MCNCCPTEEFQNGQISIRTVPEKNHYGCCGKGLGKSEARGTLPLTALSRFTLYLVNVVPDLVQCNPSCTVSHQRRNFTRLRRRQVSLLNDYVVWSRRSQRELLLFGLKQLLLQNAIPNSGLIARPRLLKSHDLIGNVHLYLAHGFVIGQLGLPDGQLVDSLVGQRLPIEDRQTQEQANPFARVITPKNLTQRR